MIITITMNPAVDKSVTVEKMYTDKKTRCENLLIEAGGGGINVSKALKELGGESLAIFPSGLSNGKLLEDKLSKREITFKTIAITNETRENFMVSDNSSNARMSIQRYKGGIELVRESKSFNMKSLITYLITGTIFLASCGGDKSTTTTESSDTASMTDHSMPQGSTDTMSNMNMGSNASIMGIMDNSMQEMKAMTSSGNPDNDFAAMMKMHHMSAIEAAQVEVAQGTDPAMKAMAQKMIDEQQKEVAEFNTFVSGHSAHGGGDGFHKDVMGMMGKMNMPMDNSGSIDKQFVTMMIPHHQSAINMSKAYIKSGAHEAKMKTMANNIIASQQKEIKELQAWLDKNK